MPVITVNAGGSFLRPAREFFLPIRAIGDDPVHHLLTMTLILLLIFLIAHIAPFHQRLREPRLRQGLVANGTDKW